jgi:hypothetical protein
MDFDRGGKSLLALTVTPEGASSLQFLDKDEKSRFVMGLSSEGAPIWGALDQNRKARIGLTITPDGRANLECCDQDEKLRLKATMTADGTPSFAVFDAQGKVIHQSGPVLAAAHLPEIAETLKTLVKLWELAEPLL